MHFSNDERAAVVKALSNPDYDWRTVDGIASETGLAKEKVQLILDYTANEIVRSAHPDSQGRVLYTTRDRYYGKLGLGQRVLSVLTDRIR